MLDRRQLLSFALLPAAWPAVVSADPRSPGERLLILVELRGANDGLNTWVPHAGEDARLYARMRPTLAIAADKVIGLTAERGLHPALAALEPLWTAGEMAVIDGLGYPQPNLSHFRSIEIWDTASRSNEYLADGWLARAFAEHPPPTYFLADGVSIGGADPGPFAAGRRTLSIASPEALVRQSRLASAAGAAARDGQRGLAHVLRLEAEARSAGARLALDRKLETLFPGHGFGQQARAAMQVLAGSPGVAALRIGLGSFDTHQAQAGTHAALLRQLADGVLALREALSELGRWPQTIIITYCEFGRRPHENASGGTDHGTANVQFAFGGAIRGGLYGRAPALTALDTTGNPAHTVDFRSFYATVLRDGWGLTAASAARVLGGDFPTLGFIRSKAA